MEVEALRGDYVSKGQQSALHVLAYTIDPSSCVTPVPIGYEDLELYRGRLITRVGAERVNN
jgi:hypothetical protein